VWIEAYLAENLQLGSNPDYTRLILAIVTGSSPETFGNAAEMFSGETFDYGFLELIF
jgi:hypothetical protein